LLVLVPNEPLNDGSLSLPLAVPALVDVATQRSMVFLEPRSGICEAMTIIDGSFQLMLNRAMGSKVAKKA
jgi:hypothetical protein